MSTPLANEEALFNAARGLEDAAERAAWLDAHCLDPALRARIDALLAVHDGDESFLNSSAQPGPPASLTERPGSVIGPYRLLEQIGEGGFGIVFMAEQTTPVRRKVALKVIKPGMDTRHVVARFEAERQVLALMEHPHIASVLDAGATESGRPYFVMELVRGIPVTDYCDQHQLSPVQRLELLVDICHAVQHAHQKGIIHRDLKPTNILVTLHDGKPVVKVIDFGVAKAIGPQELTRKTLFTGFAQLIGTPLYMSPEQAELSGLDVDTRSDVYSLGVLLYELLTGSTPFDRERLRAAALDEVRRIIREEEPPRPSLKLSSLGETLTSVSALRHTEPARLTRMLQGDLDWIVMKTLEKDRNRRYESPAAFARDIQRYLTDEPVAARPPSLAYRARKFARRNRRQLTTALLLALTLLISLGAVVGSVGWIARDRVAQRELHQQEVARIQHEHQAVLVQKIEQELQHSREAYRARHLAAALAGVERAAALNAEAGGETGRSRQIADLRADLEMVDRLERIGLEALDGKRSFRDTDLAFSSAFDAFGIPVDKGPEQECADRIRGRMIADDLVAALDYWITARSGAERSRSASAALLRIVQAADTSDLRCRIRVVWQSGEPPPGDYLAEFTDPQFFDALDPHTQQLVTWSLIRESGMKRLELLQRAQRSHPDDVWINTSLAFLLRETEPLRAAGYLRAAVAVRPDSPYLKGRLAEVLSAAGDVRAAIDWFHAAIDDEPRPDVLGVLYRELADACKAGHDPDAAASALMQAAALDLSDASLQFQIGLGLQQLGRTKEAVQAFRKAVALQPRLSDAWAALGFEAHNAGRFRESVQAYDEVIQRNERNRTAWYFRGLSHAELGDYSEAIADLEQAARLWPENTSIHYFLAVAHLAIAGEEGFHTHSGTLLDRYSTGDDQSAARNLLLTCLLLPDANVDWPALLPMAQAAAKRFAPDVRLYAAVLVRCGRYPEAVAGFNPIEASHRMRGSDWCFLAMAHERLGHSEDAEECLSRAVEWSQTARERTADSGPDDLFWYGWHEKIEFRLLLAEAQALIQSEPGAQPSEM